MVNLQSAEVQSGKKRDSTETQDITIDDEEDQALTKKPRVSRARDISNT